MQHTDDRFVSDGSTASYYELPNGATDLEDLIKFKKLPAYVAAILRLSFDYSISGSRDVHTVRRILGFVDGELCRLMATPCDKLMRVPLAFGRLLPEGAAELQDLISHIDANAQVGEIVRACYRYGQVAHSPPLRDVKKMKFYIEAEIKRLEKLEVEDG